MKYMLTKILCNNNNNTYNNHNHNYNQSNSFIQNINVLCLSKEKGKANEQLTEVKVTKWPFQQQQQIYIHQMYRKNKEQNN